MFHLNSTIMDECFLQPLSTSSKIGNWLYLNPKLTPDLCIIIFQIEVLIKVKKPWKMAPKADVLLLLLCHFISQKSADHLEHPSCKYFNPIERGMERFETECSESERNQSLLCLLHRSKTASRKVAKKQDLKDYNFCSSFTTFRTSIRASLSYFLAWGEKNNLTRFISTYWHLNGKRCDVKIGLRKWRKKQHYSNKGVQCLARFSSSIKKTQGKTKIAKTNIANSHFQNVTSSRT